MQGKPSTPSATRVRQHDVFVGAVRRPDRAEAVA